LRTLEKKGGLDSFLMATPAARLDPSVRRIRRQIQRKLAASA
jgi:hypothetical protein